MKKSNNIKFIFLLVGVVLIVVGLVYQIFFTSKSSNINDPVNPNENNDELIENTKTISYSCSKAIQNEYFGTLEYQYNFNIINDNKIESPSQLMVFTFLNQNYYDTVNVEDAFKTKKPDKINRDKNKLTKTYLWYTLIGNDEIENVDQYLELVQTYGYTCNK